MDKPEKLANSVYKTQDEDEQKKKHNTICVDTTIGKHTQIKTWTLLQASGCKAEPNIV